jgi:hypothetical protein
MKYVMFLTHGICIENPTAISLLAALHLIQAVG